MDEWNGLQTHMRDAGCDEQSILRAKAFFTAGAWEELTRCLRFCRCEQMDALHERQRQLDRLDLLIRQTQNKCKGVS